MADDVIRKVVGYLRQIEKLAEAGDLDGVLPFFTEKNVDEGRSLLVGVRPGSFVSTESISNALIRFEMLEPMFVFLAKFAPACCCCVIL